MDESQHKLLEAIAIAVGVTPSVNAVGVRQLTVGRRFVEYKKTRPRGRAWQMERNLLRPFVVRFWRRIAATLGPPDWEQHRQARRRQRTRLGRPPSELTINLELAAAKRLVPGLRDCKAVKTRTRRGSWFTAEQIERLLAAANSLRWRHQRLVFYAIVAAMADTGLRISEALGLRWDRVTLRGTTSVLGKGSKTRVIGFTGRALAAMGALERHENPHIFVNWKTGKAYDPSTVRAWFRTAIEAAGLEGVKADGDFALVPHILRHSFASIADERGAPLSWIQNAMGHSRASTTQLYIHRDDHDAAIRMASIMGRRRPPKKAVHVGAKKFLARKPATRVESFS